MVEPSVVHEVSSDEYSDFEPLLSPDGSQLFIMSDRPGGKGSMDLWVSSRTENGWGSPVNLEGPFNTVTWTTVFIFQAIIGKLLTGLQHVRRLWR